MQTNNIIRKSFEETLNKDFREIYEPLDHTKDITLANFLYPKLWHFDENDSVLGMLVSEMYGCKGISLTPESIEKNICFCPRAKLFIIHEVETFLWIYFNENK